jgi:hypothetical protein
MSDEKPPPRSGGVNVEGGGDVNVGGDVAGRDVIKTTTTNVGFGPKDVQRLVVTVAVLVFVTAGCFFTGGLAVGGVAFVALQRPVISTNEASANRFASSLSDLRALSPGQPFVLNFTEEEISSYFRLRLAPQSGVTDGKVRLLAEPGQLAVGGRASDLGNLRFAATFDLQDTPGAPLHLKAAAVQILSLGTWGESGAFGWVTVPTQLLQPLADRLNNLFGNIQLNSDSVEATAFLPNSPAWAVSGVAR